VPEGASPLPPNIHEWLERAFGGIGKLGPLIDKPLTALALSTHEAHAIDHGRDPYAPVLREWAMLIRRAKSGQLVTDGAREIEQSEAAFIDMALRLGCSEDVIGNMLMISPPCTLSGHRQELEQSLRATHPGYRGGEGP
jgi:hypothetical protein